MGAKIPHTTHDYLVKRAANWLQKTRQCGVVMPELSTYAREIPDAMGFHHHNSILVECKVSRSDFLADRKKFTRKHPEKGMGNERYYMCLPGVINKSDLPDRWGLLWVSPKKVTVMVKAVRQEANLRDERLYMYSIVRRINIRGCLRLEDHNGDECRGDAPDVLQQG